MKKFAGYLFCLSVLLALAACSTHKTAAVDSVQIWPKAPKQPKLAFVKTYTGEPDFYEPSFLDTLFGTSPRAGFQGPYGIAAKNGKIFVALSKGRAVAIVDPKEKMITYLGFGGKVKLQTPIGIAVGANDIIYVSDPGANLVAGFSQNGELRFLAGANNEFMRPTGIAINDDLQRLYVVDTRAHKVKVLSLSGETLFEFGTRGAEEGELNFPTGIAIDRQSGNVVVCDAENFRVQIFDRDGKFLKKFGQAGDGYGSFGMPKFVAIDREGNLYVTDGLSQNFQVFDREANFLLYVMGAEKGQALGRFSHPGGIFADDQDRIFLTDVQYGLIHELQYLSDRWIKEHPDEYAKYLSLQPKETPAPEAGVKAEKQGIPSDR